MSHDKNQRAWPNFSKLLIKNSKALILFASRNSWLRVSCVFQIFSCEEFVTIICTVRDPSESFCQFKHSLIILISESFTLRWDSMKTSQVTEEYGTVFIIAQRRSNFLARLELLSFNSTSLYLSQCRECGFF